MAPASYVPDLVSLTLLRELGPLLVGVVVIGRSGSAITAELGTMKVSEEIEALQVMAINPIRFLVVPRFLAMLVMLPVLTIFGNYIGFVGGWSICHFALDMNTNAFILRLVGSAHPIDLYAGIIKSFVFAWLIATIACQAGLEVTGGAEGVGSINDQLGGRVDHRDACRQRRFDGHLFLCRPKLKIFSTKLPDEHVSVD